MCRSALSSIEYNIGNAKSALVELHAQVVGALPRLADYDLLLAAKNHYWRALKALDRGGEFAHQVRTNLANALRSSARIPEAIALYDDILADAPDFGMARFHRGVAFFMLERTSHGATARLLSRAAQEYRLTIAATDLPKGVRDTAATMLEQIETRLRQHGHSPATIHDAEQATQREAADHTPFRKAMLTEHLALCEHALYCECIAARRDDLMVAVQGRPVSGDFIPRMELIVNPRQDSSITKRPTTKHGISTRTRSRSPNSSRENRSAYERNSYAPASDSASASSTR